MRPHRHFDVHGESSDRRQRPSGRLVEGNSHCLRPASLQRHLLKTRMRVAHACDLAFWVLPRSNLNAIPQNWWGARRSRRSNSNLTSPRVVGRHVVRDDDLVDLAAWLAA